MKFSHQYDRALSGRVLVAPIRPRMRAAPIHKASKRILTAKMRDATGVALAGMVDRAEATQIDDVTVEERANGLWITSERRQSPCRKHCSPNAKRTNRSLDL
jgi:hypothetical protein